MISIQKGSKKKNTVKKAKKERQLSLFTAISIEKQT